MNTTQFRVAEFARISGVTVRTLQYYDRIGLLSPSQVTEGGHRLYQHQDLLRLQQILTLKWMGFKLEQIKAVLEHPGYDLLSALRLQKQAIDQQIESLHKASEVLEQALSAAEEAADNELDTDRLTIIIEAVTAAERDEWVRQFYDDDAWAGIEMRRKQYSDADFERFQQQWQQLCADFAAVQHLPPDAPQVQSLAATMQSYLDVFIAGDPKVAEGMQRMAAARDEMPVHFKLGDDVLQSFIQQALAIYQGDTV